MLDELVEPVPLREAVARHLQGSALVCPSSYIFSFTLLCYPACAERMQGEELQRHQVRPLLSEEQSSAPVLAEVMARRAKVESALFAFSSCGVWRE